MCNYFQYATKILLINGKTKKTSNSAIKANTFQIDGYNNIKILNIESHITTDPTEGYNCFSEIFARVTITSSFYTTLLLNVPKLTILYFCMHNYHTSYIALKFRFQKYKYALSILALQRT